MKTAYYYYYYSVYRFFMTGSDDSVNDWKAMGVIQILQSIFILSIITLILAIRKYSGLPQRPVLIVFPIEIGLAVINYYSFLHLRKWKKYEATFKAYSKKTVILGRIGVLLSTLLIIAFFVFSLNIYKNINWNQYR